MPRWYLERHSGHSAFLMNEKHVSQRHTWRHGSSIMHLGLDQHTTHICSPASHPCPWAAASAAAWAASTCTLAAAVSVSASTACLRAISACSIASRALPFSFSAA